MDTVAAVLAEINSRVGRLQGEIAERQGRLDELLSLVPATNGAAQPKTNGHAKRKYTKKAKADKPEKAADPAPEAEPAITGKAAARDSRVHRYLLTTGPRKASHIVEALKIPNGSISAILKRLLDGGAVEVCPEGFKAK